MKAVQITITETTIVKELAQAGENGLGVMHVVPNDALAIRHSQLRLDPLMYEVWKYRQLTKAPRIKAENVFTKGFGRGFIMVLGSEASANVTSVPIDMLVIDELDECNKENVEKLPDRLAASPWKYRIYIGNPSVEDFGIAAWYADSDQKEWRITCESCLDQQPLDWFANVVDGKELRDKAWDPLGDRDIYVLCRKCGKAINRLADGKWVARKRSRVSGYTASRLVSPMTTVQSLYEKYQRALGNPMQLAAFKASDLGIPGSGAGDQLTPEFLNSLRGAHGMSWSTRHKCVMGIDIGKIHHYWILEVESGNVLFVGSTDNVLSLVPVIETMNIQCVVLDIMPELVLAKDFQDRARRAFPTCSVWRAQTLATSKPGGLTKDFKEGIISFGKTEQYDEFFASLHASNITLPADLMDKVPDFVNSMMAIKRIPVVRNERMLFAWQKVRDEDHYFSAGVFAVTARQLVAGRSNFKQPQHVVQRPQPFPLKKYIGPWYTSDRSPFAIDVPPPWRQ